MIVTALLLAAVGIALTVDLAAARAIRRRIVPFGPAGSSRSRAGGLLRSVPAALAAVLAFIAAARVSMDASFEIGGGIVLVLVTVGVAAAIVAVALAWLGTSSQVPYLAGSFAITCALLLLVSSPLALARTVCACTSSTLLYLPPTLAGMDATTWAVISAVGSPVLLLVALVRRS
jgi:hypothetical protein